MDAFQSFEFSNLFPQIAQISAELIQRNEFQHWVLCQLWLEEFGEFEQQLICENQRDLREIKSVV